jgi:sialate O-acetylesterase
MNSLIPPVIARPCIAWIFGCFLLLSPHSLRAEVRLPAIFSEHMVLRKAEAVPVWGQANPGEHVRVSLDGKAADAAADASGNWRVELNLKDCGAGPFEMTVQGNNRVVIQDVVVGEVWLASGQSNMEHPLRATLDADREIATSTNHSLRQFLVKRAGAKQPAVDCQGRWTVAGPETSGEFTAVGYYFGKELQQTQKIPVGIINSSHGGTYIEPWTPADVFDRVDSFKISADALRRKAEEYPTLKAKFAADFTAWLKAHGREDRPRQPPARYADENVSTGDWHAVTLPGKVSDAGFPSSGIFWIRREIEVSALLAQQGFKIMIGPLEGSWQVYWNGEKIDEMTYARMPGKGFSCYFAVPREQIRAGSNTLAIRVFSPTSPLVVTAASLWAGPLVLNGRWFAQVERSFPELSPEAINSAPRITYSPPEMSPGNLFNGMINPLIPYSISGVLWYQGESNTKRAYEYRIALPTLIQGWREKWHRDDLPFYFCQVCNNFGKLSRPAESAWAELRESQSLALALPHTGQAISIELGEAGDLHFRDKKPLGHRLFLIAAAKHYGRSVDFSVPVYKSVAFEAGRARVRFEHTEGGLMVVKLTATYSVKTLTGETAPLVRNSPRSEVEGFAICGADHQWFWADARIDGDSVLVWSDEVPQPVAVRYAWADNPTCNLYNGAGLPASTFRTDDFPISTQDNHF